MSIGITGDAQRIGAILSPAAISSREARPERAVGSGQGPADQSVEGVSRMMLRNALDRLDRARLAEATLADSDGQGTGEATRRLEGLAVEDHRFAEVAGLVARGDVSGARDAAGALVRAAEGEITGATLAVANVSASGVSVQDADAAADLVSGIRDIVLSAGASALAAQANQPPDRVAGLLD